MGMSLTDLTDDLRLRRMVDLFDDFNSYTDTQSHTKGGTGAGNSVANADGVNGLLTLTTGGVLNNESFVATTRKNWLLQNAPTVSPLPSGKGLVGEFRINYAEANTNKAGIFVGFSDALAAGLLVDTTLVPKATAMSTIGIYKMVGETVWRTLSQNSTTQNIHKSTKSSISTADQILRVEARVLSATLAEVSYFVNGDPLFDSAVVSQNFRIKDLFTITSLNKMAVGAFVKAGSASSEVMNLDYECALALR